MENSKIISIVENFLENNAGEHAIELYRHYADNPRDRPMMDLVEPSSIVELAKMILDLKKEIALAEGKKAHGASFAKRSKLAEKITKGCIRPQLIGSYSCMVDGEKRQCFTNGYMAFAMSEPLLVPEMENPEDGLNLDKLFPGGWREFPVTSYDAGKIGAEWKMHKKDGCVVEFFGKFFDAKFFLDCVTVLGDDVTFYNIPDPLSASFFESKNGIALLMPVRKRDGYHVIDGQS